ncbi:MAG: peptidylprolyl isomerase [Dehalococcoidia bacterium]|jgi:peptidylprolyl isomerase|nr:peptidylprolyl isomerase [Chloroflexota bacterium]MCK4242571.1 peptidylprolyl isomerase [Dehalococcoidia bacterium]
MGQAEHGATVKVHYTGKLDDGTVFASSTEHEPLEFKIGESQVIPDFEQAVIGLNPGESKAIKIPADKAYGPYEEEMVVAVDRDRLPPNFQPEVGQQLQVSQADGRTITVMVTDVSESSVMLDANHPLAGKDLNFDIQLVEIL